MCTVRRALWAGVAGLAIALGSVAQEKKDNRSRRPGRPRDHFRVPGLRRRRAAVPQGGRP